MTDPLAEEFDNGVKGKDRATNVKGDLELGKKTADVDGSKNDGKKIDWIRWILEHKMQVFILFGVVTLVSIIVTITGPVSSSKSNEMAIAVQETETAEIPPSSTTITNFPTFSPTPVLAIVPIATLTPTTLNPIIYPSEKPTPMSTPFPTLLPTPLPTLRPTPFPTKMPTASPTRAQRNPPTQIPVTSISSLIAQTEMPIFPPTLAPTGPCDWFLNP